MNLAIVGYGKMGRLIEQLAPEYGFDVKLRLDMDNNAKFEGMTTENFRGIDAAMEFSTPATAPENIERLARLGVNTVIGTTGWFGEMERARAAVERGGTGLVWSPNFSVGVKPVQSDCCRGGAAVRAPAGIWRVGMGNPPRDEKRRAVGHAARAG